MTPASPRVVFDTNTLVAAAYNPRSASRRLVDAALAARLRVFISAAVRREYDFVLPRAVRLPKYLDSLWRLIDAAEAVEPAEVRPAVASDPSDDKFVALARSAGAILVTADRAVRQIDASHGVQAVSPRTAESQLISAGCRL